MKAVLVLCFLLQAFIMVAAQESINPHAGVNIGMHVGIALAMSFGILATCAIGVNLVHKNMACARIS